MPEELDAHQNEVEDKLLRLFLHVITEVAEKLVILFTCVGSSDGVIFKLFAEYSSSNSLLLAHASPLESLTYKVMKKSVFLLVLISEQTPHNL